MSERAIVITVPADEHTELLIASGRDGAPSIALWLRSLGHARMREQKKAREESKEGKR